MKSKKIITLKDYFLKLELSLSSRVLESNVSLVSNKSNSNQEIIFAISLKSKQVSKNWKVVQDNLSKTLNSILNNTHQNYRIIIAGHEKPNIKEINNKFVTWLPVNFAPPFNSSGFTKDKMKKRMVIGKYLREEGFSGFFMPLDADDWIHYRFVEYLNSCDFSKAYIINKGIMINFYRNKSWLLNDFYKHCGSSAIFYFSKEKFPKKIRKDNKTFSVLTLNRHRLVFRNLKRLKMEYQIIEHPLVCRCFGHGDNNMLIKRTLKNNVTGARYKVNEEQYEKWLLDFFKV